MGSTPTGISASRGSAILGLNKYKSPLVAWLEIMEERIPGFCLKNGYEKPENSSPWEEPLDPKKAALRWGLAFEDSICYMVKGIIDREKFFNNEKHGFPMTCHIDGIKNGIIQENKTAFDMAFKMGWGIPGSDMIPDSYQIQIQHQMFLTGLNKSDINVLVFPKSPAEWENSDLRINLSMGVLTKDLSIYCSILSFAESLQKLGFFHKYTVKADPVLQKKMIEKYKLFWNDNILKEIPPPISGYDDIAWLFSSPEGEIEASIEMAELWSEYIDIDNEIESMKERMKEIKFNFSLWVQKQLLSKKIKPGNEKRKINVFAGRRKLFSITKAFPGLKVSQSMVSTLKENDPEAYELMKKTSFSEILPEFVPLTDRQEIKKLELEKDLEKDLVKTTTEIQKMFSSLKLTKLLTSDSIMKQLEKNRPDLFRFFIERGIAEMTKPRSTLRISKPEKE